MAKKDLLTKFGLAKRMASKYKNLNISDCEAMIGLVLDEILDAVLIDKLIVDLPKVCRIGLRCVRMYGYDFKLKKKRYFDWSFKAFCEPNYYLRERAKIITPSLLDIDNMGERGSDGTG